MIAKLKQVRISPKKANLIAGLVRRKKVVEALDILKFTNKKAAPILHKLLSSAVANAENNFKQNKEELIVNEIIVNEGVTYKRGVAISRGRSHPILKRTSHITVKLIVDEGKNEEKKEDKKIEKEDKEEKTTKSKDK